MNEVVDRYRATICGAQYAAMLRGLHIDGYLAVTRLARLARSTHDVLEIAATLNEIGIDLALLEQAINTATPGGRLSFTMLGAFGEFEAERIGLHQMS